jgi:hypothetical protein
VSGIARPPAPDLPAATEAAKPGAPAGPVREAPRESEKAPASAAPAMPQVEKPASTTARGSGGARGPASAPAAASAKAAPAALVAVTIEGPYEFEVFDGSRSISPPARVHQLPPQPEGKLLRLVAPSVFLDRSVRVEGGEGRTFDYTVPALGLLDIRSLRQDCRVMIGKRDLGNLPLPPVQVVAGEYQVSLSCPDGLNPTRQATAVAGRTIRVGFTEK